MNSATIAKSSEKNEHIALAASPHQHQESYRLLVEMSPDAIFINQAGRLVYANPAFLRLMGASDVQQVLGKSPFDFTHPDYHGLIAERMKAVQEGWQIAPLVEQKLIRLDGSVCDVEVVAAPFPYEGGVAIQAILRDITERKKMEAKLIREHTLLRTVIDNLPVYIYAKDQQSRFLLNNRAHLQILGATQQADVIGKTDFDIFPKELAHQYFADERRVIEQGEAILDCEEEVVSPQGQHLCVLTTKVPLYDECGAVIGLVGVTHDISAHKTMQEQLRESQAQMHGIINSAMDAIITIDEEQKIVLFNPAAERMFGYEMQTLLGQPVELLLPERVKELHRHHVEEFGQTNTTRRRMGALGELTGRRANGEEFPIEASISQVLTEGKKLYSVILRDVSARVRAETALRQSEARQRALLQTIPDAIFRVRRDGIYLDYKAPINFKTILPPEEMVGKHHQDFLPAEVSRQLAHAIEQALTTGKLQQYENPIAINGQFYAREVRVMPSGVDEVTVIIRDITEQKKAEEAQRQAVTDERNRLARELHDSVTQTLFGASIIADVLPKIWKRKPAEAERRLVELRQLNRGALAEMRTLLMELRPEAIISADMNLLLQQLSDALNGRARIPVDLQIFGEVSLSPDVKVALYRIAQEALNNIAKHSEATQVNLSLTCQGDAVSLRISDNGIGFVHEGITSDHLGLRIIHERAQEINAMLQVQSQPNQGTTIAVDWRGAGTVGQ